MLQFSDIDRLTQGFALAIPVAVLITLALLLRVTSRRRRARDAEIGAPPVAVAKSDLMLEDDRKGPAPITMFKRAPAAVVAEPRVVTPQSQPQSAGAPVGGPVAGRTAALEARLGAAPAAEIAALYLQIASAHAEQGNDDARMTALRAAAGLAAKNGAKADHAEARLQLGEAAFAAGDLHGACEQWQMARTALLESGQKEAYERIDKRMRDNGCPTDWVLTDF